MVRSNLTSRETVYAFAQEPTYKFEMGDTASASDTPAGANLLCPGELPGKREMKQWLDAAIPTLLVGDASLVYEGMEPSSFAGLQLRVRVNVLDAGADKTLKYRMESDNRKIDGQRLKAKKKITFLGPECYHPKRNAAGQPRYKKSVCAVFEHPETGAEVELLVEDPECTEQARPAWIEVKAAWVELYDRYVREGVDTSWDVFE